VEFFINPFSEKLCFWGGNWVYFAQKCVGCVRFEIDGVIIISCRGKALCGLFGEYF
jgi:hypothetical protein